MLVLGDKLLHGVPALSLKSGLRTTTSYEGRNASVLVAATPRCDYGGYLAPDGLPDPILVRQLRELAWAVRTIVVTVLFAGPTFPEITTLEKEIKMIELPLPDGREVERILDLRLHQLRESPDARVHVDEHAHEQLAQALLGLTETEIDNALAKAAITLGGLNADALPLVLDEKRSVIRQSGSLTYSHPEPADHLGGYTHLRQLLHEAAATFTPAARAFGVEPHKGLLLVGLPGCGKDLCKRSRARPHAGGLLKWSSRWRASATCRRCSSVQPSPVRRGGR